MFTDRPLAILGGRDKPGHDQDDRGDRRRRRCKRHHIKDLPCPASPVGLAHTLPAQHLAGGAAGQFGDEEKSISRGTLNFAQVLDGVGQDFRLQRRAGRVAGTRAG